MSDAGHVSPGQQLWRGEAAKGEDATLQHSAIDGKGLA